MDIHARTPLAPACRLKRREYRARCVAKVARGYNREVVEFSRTPVGACGARKVRRHHVVDRVSRNPVGR